MIEEITTAIEDSLKTLNITVKRYLGELSSHKEPQILKDELPVVFIDFTGDSPKGYERDLFYNLYFVHISYSKNEKNRSAKTKELISLLEKADLKLYKTKEASIKVNKTKKIFDAKITEGYLTIFTKNLTATISNEEVTQWKE